MPAVYPKGRPKRWIHNVFRRSSPLADSDLEHFDVLIDVINIDSFLSCSLDTEDAIVQEKTDYTIRAGLI